MKNNRSKEILKYMDIKKKYDCIEAFLVGIYPITNVATPTITERITSIVKEELMYLSTDIQKDIEEFEFENVDLEDLFGVCDQSINKSKHGVLFCNF